MEKVRPHASPRKGWRHEWCKEDCPFHDMRMIPKHIRETIPAWNKVKIEFFGPDELTFPE